MDNQDRNVWSWGFTAGAENWNGRLAMLGFVSALIVEAISGKGVLHFLGLM
uniref:chlorophyll a/b-binding protein n=1 Tax=Synechococcus sp. C9 TaxID=102119 RepID=UPI0024860874|nr:chlorophyll a/b-binding protein [Synechococcus sp. C9]